MTRTKPYTGEGELSTKHEPNSGETVVISVTMNGHRSVYRITGSNGWRAEFASRLAALAFCQQNSWRVRASLLDRETMVDQFSGGSPPREVRS
jgi:hypothetical protein